MTAESSADAAIRDLEERTLADLPGLLAKLVYIASTRDYNTGRYRHEGLALIYTAETAERALRRCHEKIFREVVCLSLQELKEDLETYLQSTGEDPQRVLDAWCKLEAYRVLMPAGYDELAEELFVLNVRIVLAALRPADVPEGPGRPIERPPL
jgi:hypothetical protein